MKTNLSMMLVAAAFAGSMVSGSALAGGDRIRLQCDSQGVGDTSMDARYQERRGRAKFDGSFEAAPGGDFADGDLLTVVVGSIEVGTIALTTQLNGDIGGDIEFDTRADELNPFPKNFPDVAAGTSVTVGPLGCALGR
jgi:hypothetical protein